MDEKKNKRLVIVIIILLSIIVLMTSYIVYDAIYRNDKKVSGGNVVDVSKEDDKLQQDADKEQQKQDNSEDKEQQKEEDSDDDEEQDNEESLLTKNEKLYYDAFGVDENELRVYTLGYWETGAFKDSEINPLIKLYSDKKYLINEKFDYNTKMGIAAEPFLGYMNLHLTGDEEPEKILVSDVKKSYEKLFGEIPKINDFFYFYIGECKLSGDYFICDPHTSNQPVDTGRIDKEFIGKLYKVEEKNDEIYIYEKICYQKSIYSDDTYQASEVYYYSDINLKNEIKELRGKESDELLKDTYDELLPTYKYTLKKSSSGTYIAYSIEPVK